MEINAKTKIDDLLKQHPYLIDFLITLSPMFKNLKNPVMRKTLGKVASLEKVAGIGGLEVESLISALNAEIKKQTGNVPVSDASAPDLQGDGPQKPGGFLIDLHGRDARFAESIEPVEPDQLVLVLLLKVGRTVGDDQGRGAVRGGVKSLPPEAGVLGWPGAVERALRVVPSRFVAKAEDDLPSYVKIGVVAGDGGAVIWPLLVGVNRAKELLMTGDMLDAEEAFRIGLVNHVVPHEELMEVVRNRAAQLVSGSTLAIRGTKKSVNAYMKWMVNQVLDLSMLLEKECIDKMLR